MCLKGAGNPARGLQVASLLIQLKGFPGGTSGKEPTCQCGRCERCGFNPWDRKIPWKREWQPTQVCLPGESHEQRNLAGYGPEGRKESDPDSAALTHTPGPSLRASF